MASHCEIQLGFTIIFKFESGLEILLLHTKEKKLVCTTNAVGKAEECESISVVSTQGIGTAFSRILVIRSPNPRGFHCDKKKVFEESTFGTCLAVILFVNSHLKHYLILAPTCM